SLIQRHAGKFTAAERTSIVRFSWNQADRSMRQAVANLIQTLDPIERTALMPDRAELTWAFLTKLQGSVLDDPILVFVDTLPFLRKPPPNTSEEQVLAALRLMQMALGDIGDPTAKGEVREGYSLRKAKPAGGSKYIAELAFSLTERFVSRGKQWSIEV